MKFPGNNLVNLIVELIGFIYSKEMLLDLDNKFWLKPELINLLKPLHKTNFEFGEREELPMI